MDQVRQLRSGTLPRRAGSATLEVCPKCDHHMRMSARNRLHSLLDEGSLVELGSELEPKDVLKFRDSKKYKDHPWRPLRKRRARKTRWW